MSAFTPTYQQRCDYATTMQGLDPVVNTLREAGYEVDVDQTGGFCMAIVINCNSGHVVLTAAVAHVDHMCCGECGEVDSRYTVDMGGNAAKCSKCGHVITLRDIDEVDEKRQSVLFMPEAQINVIETESVMIGSYPGTLWSEGEDSGHSFDEIDYIDELAIENVVEQVQTYVAARGGAR